MSMPCQDPSLTIEARIADLVSRMTLEEKAAQLTAVWLTLYPLRCQPLAADRRAAQAMEI